MDGLACDPRGTGRGPVETDAVTLRAVSAQEKEHTPNRSGTPSSRRKPPLNKDESAAEWNQ